MSAAGRPRDPAIDAAVLAATLEILRTDGYPGFALEAVAARAGTTKAAMRRRWPLRQNLLIDALASILTIPPVPDNNCTRCDLMQSVRLLDEALHERLPRGVLAPLVADCARVPELHQRLMEVLVQPSRQAATAAVEQAVSRGDLRPGVDPHVLVDLLAASVYQRALLGDTTTARPSAADTVDLLLRGAAVDFDRLVQISQTPAHLRQHPASHT
ncbi:TetR-like C-terminal domain-containing protein [Streptomyces melanogenes]|uniref:TetR-like C-terminal domain-containing protein n=1 Tax=Streptomyces melanogenes TaxID=67326 RepID=UPI00167C9E6A|nr:TetR-like C-terminal domain-containing protein [Streptomyces melanogenes]GGP33302.1 TetR family transcriptional regulator [Streptomyces melanogenes]